MKQKICFTLLLSLEILTSMGLSECYMSWSPLAAKSTNFHRNMRPTDSNFYLNCIDGRKMSPSQSMVALNEINPRFESSSSELSNVNAVRYFINLTNGIEAVGTLLKQGVPMEHINVRNLFHVQEVNDDYNHSLLS